MKVKKLLLFILTVIAFVCVTVFVSSAATYNGMTYTVKNGEVTITDCDTSKSGALTIPLAIEGYPVTSIGSYAFSGCYRLTSVEIPNSIKSIDDLAFSTCEGITNLNIPDSVISIGSHAFANCSKIKCLTIGKSVKSIGSSAFDKCSGITQINYNACDISDFSPLNVFYRAGTSDSGISVVFGNDVEKIPDYLFHVNGSSYDRPKVTSVTISDSVISIGNSAFSCTIIERIKIGNNVINIGDNAFSYCNNIGNIEIPDSVTSIGDYAFYNCTSLTSIILGNNVESIGQEAFCYCESLSKIEIPDSVTSISDYAFNNCTSLTSIEISDSVTSIGGGTFSGCCSLEKITLPFTGDKRHTSTDIYQYPFGYIFDTSSYAGGVATKQYYYGSSTSSITYSTYYIPEALKEVVITDCEYIPYGTFYNCTGLTSISIPKDAKNVGGNAFYNTAWYNNQPDGLVYAGKVAYKYKGNCPASVQIKEGTFGIAGYAFNKCNSLTNIEIPDSVASIGYDAFRDCTSLTSVYITDITAWCKIDFENFYSNPLNNGSNLYVDGELATNIKIPDGVMSIGSYAFINCKSLKSVIIGDTVTSVGREVFYGCNSLKSLIFTGKPPKELSTPLDSSEYDGMVLAIIPKNILIWSNMFEWFSFDGTVFYPYDINEWKSLTSIYEDNYTSYSAYFSHGCNKVSFIKYDNNDTVKSISIKQLPKTLYNQGDDIDFSMLRLSAVLSGGPTWDIIPDILYPLGKIEFSNITTETDGIKNVTVSFGGKETSFNIGVHKVVTFVEDESKYPESPHNYANNSDETKTYSYPDALKLKVTFSKYTFFEELSDYIYVNNVKYSGAELAGKTIEINGNKLAVRFTSDDYINYYGYSIDKIEVTAVEHEEITVPAISPTCTKSGLAEGKRCNICGEILVSQTYLPAKSHSYKTTTDKATLTKSGKIETKCSVCGNVKSSTAIAYPKTFTLSATKFTYTGKAIKPTVTVKDSNGKVVSSSNYTVSYSGNVNAGTGKVTITFKGNYSGTKTVNFTITPKQTTGLKVSDEKTTSLKLTWSKTAGAKYYKVEQSTDGKKWKTLTTTDKTSYTVKSLKAGTKYQFRVTALDSTKKIAGKASSVLKTGTLTSAPTLTLKSTKSKTATASWKKVTGASKYVVYKSTNGKKWTKVTTTTKTSYNLTKLTGGKKIYVKVRAVNAYGKSSAYSSVKKATVKK